MRSQLLEMKNYMTLPLEELDQHFPPSALASEVNNDVQRDLLSHRRLTDCDTVAAGDTVTVCLEGSTPRYQRKALPLTVGKGLFDPALEAALVGRAVGERFSAPSAEGPVPATVLQCCRRIVPELNDAFVLSLDLEGVSTVAQYRTQLEDHYRQFYHEGYVDFFAQDLFNRMCEHSRWALDEAEMAELNARWHALQAEVRTFHDTVLGDEENARQILAIEEEDLLFLVRLFLVDCLMTGVDSRTVMPDLSNRALQQLRERVLKPIARYLDDKVHVDFEAEEEAL